MIEIYETNSKEHYHYNQNLPDAEILIAEHDVGSSWKTIGKKYDVSESTIWSRIYKHNHSGDRKPNVKFSGIDNGMFRPDLDTQKMIEDYQLGMSTSRIAEKYSCGKTTVKRKLKASGVPMRSNSEAQLVEVGGTISAPKRPNKYPDNPILDNKYSRKYYTVISKARQQNSGTEEYYERHHIHPKALGGSNKPDNLIKLTPKEHYVCHRLLTKCTCEEGRRYMVNAWARMSRSPKTNKYITSTQYAELRKQLKIVGMSEEHKRKIGNAHRGMKYTTMSEESKHNMSKARKKDWAEGKYKSQIEAAKKPKSEETKKKMSEAGRVYWENKRLENLSNK